VSAVASKRSSNPAYEVELALMPLDNLHLVCTAIASCLIAIGGLPAQCCPGTTQHAIAQIELRSSAGVISRAERTLLGNVPAPLAY